MPKDAKTIQEELCAPFAAADLEWRIQMAFPDDMRGIAVPYVTNRAIQNRLDSVVGVDHWYNDYKPWHGAGKKESQICGISIFFEDRGWITKWDGAEDSDIEPIKGGLSDSMKRSAVQWGIGRILYGMDTVYVDIEKKGKNFVIKKSERPKLDGEYNKYLKSLSLTPASAGGTQSQLIPRESAGEPAQTPPPAKQQSGAAPATQPKAAQSAQSGAPASGSKRRPATEYIIMNARIQGGMSGSVSTCLALTTPDGKRATAFVQGAHPELKPGMELFNVKKELKKQDSVVFYLLHAFDFAAAEPDAQAA